MFQPQSDRTVSDSTGSLYILDRARPGWASANVGIETMMSERTRSETVRSETVASVASESLGLETTEFESRSEAGRSETLGFETVRSLSSRFRPLVP